LCLRREISVVLAFCYGLSYKGILAVRTLIFRYVVLVVCAGFQISEIFAFGENQTLRIIQSQTMFIRHTATEYQRRVAEQNAKAFFSHLTPEKKAELKKKKIKTVLIPTVRSKETSPAAQEVRMRFSLEGESLIDDYAYELPTPLQAGTIAKLNGLDPEYVGQ
jgi:hypothetical protein